MQRISKILFGIAIFFVLIMLQTRPAFAAAQIGMHVLRPEEFQQTVDLFQDVRKDKSQPLYVTVPFTLDDTTQIDRWQKAFDYAKEENIVPILRLSTRFDTSMNAWTIPTTDDILALSNALNELNWPQDDRYVILFNEPNHAAEWGNTLDPVSFADVSNFTADWFLSNAGSYKIMPAGLDLAASNTKDTQDAMQFWSKAAQQQPGLIDKFAAWNSHSYPNPGFASAPQRTGRNSLLGFTYELAFVKNHTSHELSVFITETGWKDNNLSQATLSKYYTYAVSKIWSKSNIVAVTPFLLAGNPGPYGNFSFVDEKGAPTSQWNALESAIADQQRKLVTER